MNKLAALALSALVTTLVACAAPDSDDETVSSAHADLALSDTFDSSFHELHDTRVTVSLSRPLPSGEKLVPYDACQRTYACTSTLGTTRWVLVESKTCKFPGYDRYLPLDRFHWLGGELATASGDGANFTVRLADVASDDGTYDCAEASK